MQKNNKELRSFAKNVLVRLTGSSRKADIADRLIAMAQIGAIRDEATDSNTDGDITEIHT